MLSGRPHLPPHYRVHKGPVVALVAALMWSGLANVGNAQGAKKLSASNLEGAWSGGGFVSFASGAKEQARYRARYSRAGKDSYTVNAKSCANG